MVLNEERDHVYTHETEELYSATQPTDETVVRVGREIGIHRVELDEVIEASVNRAVSRLDRIAGGARVQAVADMDAPPAPIVVVPSNPPLNPPNPPLNPPNPSFVAPPPQLEELSQNAGL